MQIVDVQVAPPKRLEVRIKIIGSGVCHTDYSEPLYASQQFPVILGQKIQVKNIEKMDYEELTRKNKREDLQKGVFSLFKPKATMQQEVESKDADANIIIFTIIIFTLITII